MKKQVHVYYSGRVQGIGFRFTVKDIADDFKITGWVKNLDDNRVEVTAESGEDTLKQFLDKVSQHFSHYIKDTDIQWYGASGQFPDFGIEF